jgi:cytochrome c oxidase subunit II
LKSLPQSALDHAAPEAERIATLFWWMTGGAAVIWAGVVGLTLWATYLSPGPRSLAGSRRLIIVGGVVFPTVVLTGLLTVGLFSLPSYLAPPPPGSLRILVTGEQWW